MLQVRLLSAWLNKVFADKFFFCPKRVSKDLLIIIVILIIAFALRVYNLEQGFGYFGDQGRDLIEVRRLFTSGQIPLVGPSASVGYFHLGPIFYLFLAPFLLIGNFQPIGAVYLNLLCSLLLVLVSYIFLKRNVGSISALATAILLTFSFHAIFLGRGSWNPNIIPLFSVLLFLFLTNFIKNNRRKSLFLSFIILGIGVQLHYTFLANIIAVLACLLLFKPRTFLELKNLGVMVVGFVIPLIPFIYGQFQLSFADFIALKNYLISPQIQQIHNVPLYSRLVFPFQIYFIPDSQEANLQVVILLTTGVLFLTSTLLAFSKTRIGLISKLLLVFMIIDTILAIYFKIPLNWWYFEHFALITIYLIGIVIEYLYSKQKYLCFLISFIFIVYELFVINNAYRLNRTPQIVYKISQVIEHDYTSLNKSLSLYVLSPVTTTDGYEYRYLLEKDGIMTASTNDLDRLDYIIVEGQDSTSTVFTTAQKGIVIRKYQDLIFDDQSQLIKKAAIFKIERN